MKNLQRTLFVVSRIGPLEGAILSAYAEARRPCGMAALHGDGVAGGSPIARALTARERAGLRLPKAGRLLAADGCQIIGVGREAAAWLAARVPTGSFAAMLTRADLNGLSPRHPKGLNDFLRLSERASRLVVEDHWEMEKASIYGSQIPHFAWPAFPEGVGLLSPDGATAVLAPGDWSGEAVREALSRVAAPTGGIRNLAIEDLYTPADAQQGAVLFDVLRGRLAGCSRAVILGDSPATAPILAALRGSGAHVIAETTLNTSYGLSKLGSAARRARGMAIAQALFDDLHGREAPVTPLSSPSWDAPQDADFPSGFDRVLAANVPSHFEELLPARRGGSFTVFASVAPIENRANGARPQRIRNMAEAFHQRGPNIVMRADRNLLARRSRLLDDILAAGWRPELIYGENSTSPIPDPELLTDFTEVLSSLRRSGAPVGWFVRDLYWARPDADADVTDADVERGRDELQAIAAISDLLYTSSPVTDTYFRRLAQPLAIELPRSAHLPPALQQDNLIDMAELGEGLQMTTLVYCGHIGGHYRQDMYIEAMRTLSQDAIFHFDFVVWPDEAAAARDLFTSAGVRSDRCRVLTYDFSEYVSRTKRSIGVAFFDGEYASRAFQYKVLSMLERGMRVACFEDQSVAWLLERVNAGVVTGRSVSDITTALTAAAHEAALRPQDLLPTDSWQARVRQVSHDLAGESRTR